MGLVLLKLPLAAVLPWNTYVTLAQLLSYAARLTPTIWHLRRLWRGFPPSPHSCWFLRSFCFCLDIFQYFTIPDPVPAVEALAGSINLAGLAVLSYNYGRLYPDLGINMATQLPPQALVLVAGVCLAYTTRRRPASVTHSVPPREATGKKPGHAAGSASGSHHASTSAAVEESRVAGLRNSDSRLRRLWALLFGQGGTTTGGSRSVSSPVSTFPASKLHPAALPGSPGSGDRVEAECHRQPRRSLEPIASVAAEAEAEVAEASSGGAGAATDAAAGAAAVGDDAASAPTPTAAPQDDLATAAGPTSADQHRGPAFYHPFDRTDAEVMYAGMAAPSPVFAQTSFGSPSGAEDPYAAAAAGVGVPSGHAARRLPPYRPFIQSRYVYTKLHGYEPTQISDGYEQRIALLIAALAGNDDGRRRLGAVYVRPGCIELLIEEEDWGPVWGSGNNSVEAVEWEEGGAPDDSDCGGGGGGGSGALMVVRPGGPGLGGLIAGEPAKHAACDGSTAPAAAAAATQAAGGGGGPVRDNAGGTGGGAGGGGGRGSLSLVSIINALQLQAPEDRSAGAGAEGAEAAALPEAEAGLEAKAEAEAAARAEDVAAGAAPAAAPAAVDAALIEGPAVTAAATLPPPALPSAAAQAAAQASEPGEANATVATPVAAAALPPPPPPPCFTLTVQPRVLLLPPLAPPKAPGGDGYATTPIPSAAQWAERPVSGGGGLSGGGGGGGQGEFSLAPQAPVEPASTVVADGSALVQSSAAAAAAASPAASLHVTIQRLTAPAAGRSAPMSSHLEVLVRARGAYLPARVHWLPARRAPAGAGPGADPGSGSGAGGWGEEGGGEDDREAAGGADVVDQDVDRTRAVAAVVDLMELPPQPGVLLLDVRWHGQPCRVVPLLVTADPRVEAELSAAATTWPRSASELSELLFDVGVWEQHAHCLGLGCATPEVRLAPPEACAPSPSPGPRSPFACPPPLLPSLGRHLLGYSLACGWRGTAERLTRDLARLAEARVHGAAAAAAEAPPPPPALEAPVTSLGAPPAAVPAASARPVEEEECGGGGDGEAAAVAMIHPGPQGLSAACTTGLAAAASPRAEPARGAKVPPTSVCGSGSAGAGGGGGASASGPDGTAGAAAAAAAAGPGPGARLGARLRSAGDAPSWWRALLLALGLARAPAAEEAAFGEYAETWTFAQGLAIRMIDCVALAGTVTRCAREGRLLSLAPLPFLMAFGAGAASSLARLVLRPRSWAALERRCRLARYGGYMAGKAVIAWGGSPVPPGVDRYLHMPAMLLLQGLIVPGSCLLPLPTALLVLPALNLLTVFELLACKAPLGTAVLISLRTAVVGLATNLACHVYMRRCFHTHWRLRGSGRRLQQAAGLPGGVGGVGELGDLAPCGEGSAAASKCGKAA